MEIQRAAERANNHDRALTYDDLLRFPEDTQRREIIGGELIVSPSPDWWHQRLVLHVRDLIVASEAGKLGEVAVAPLDVRLTTYDTVQPDLFFVRSDRMSILMADGRITGSPDLVVEVVSPTSHALDRVRKFALYAGAGVPEYWIVDAIRREVPVHVLNGNRYAQVPVDPDGVSASRVLPGFVVDPAAIFAVLPPR